MTQSFGVPKALSQDVFAYFHELCKTSDRLYCNGGMTFDYSMKAGFPPYQDGTDLSAFLKNKKDNARFKLPAAEHHDFVCFLELALGEFKPDPLNFDRAQVIASKIVEVMRSDLNSSFVSCCVEMDDNGISGSAELMAIVAEHNYYHLVSFDWQFD